MCQVVAYKRWKTEKNIIIEMSAMICGGGHLQEVVVSERL